MTDLKGYIPESWRCIDCGVNTAPGCSTRRQAEQVFTAIRNDQSATQTFDDRTEVYHVREKVWKAARMDRNDGCLCIGCLEKRIKRRLKPEDFPRNNPLNSLPGSDRLLSRK